MGRGSEGELWTIWRDPSEGNEWEPEAHDNGETDEKEREQEYAGQKDGKWKKNKTNKEINEVLGEKFIWILVCPSTLLGRRTAALEYPDTPPFILACW